MIVTIEICTKNKRVPTKSDIQKNIDALKRAIGAETTAMDTILISDTISILYGIQKKLPEE